MAPEDASKEEEEEDEEEGRNSRLSMPMSEMCTMRGLSDGRPFAVYIPRTASLRVASAPRP